MFYPSGDSEQFTWDPHPGHMLTWQSNVGARSQYGHLTWHINGTLAQLQIQDGAYPSNNQTCTYGYDDLVRLSSVNCGASIWEQNFSYDRYGNITKSVPQGSQGAAFAATYNTANNRVSNLGFSYDADGNVLNDNAFNMFIYDAEGRQANVNAFVTYFDASNRVVTIQNPDAYYEIVYAPDGYKMAIMNGTSVVRYSAPLAAGVQAVYTANSPARIGYWRHADWQGSSRIASTIAQQVYYDGSYAPFGENYNETGDDRSFTGQTQDTSSGIYDFPFRQQSSNQGRWFVPDPQDWERLTSPIRRASTAMPTWGIIQSPMWIYWGCMTTIVVMMTVIAVTTMAEEEAETGVVVRVVETQVVVIQVDR